MKLINNFILEKLKLNSQSKLTQNNWTIEDAQEGDIITAQYEDVIVTFIFKCIFNSRDFGNVIKFHAFYYWDDHSCEILKGFDDGHLGELKDYKSGRIKSWKSTNKEKQVFFNALKNIGYTWNDKLKKIENI